MSTSSGSGPFYVTNYTSSVGNSLNGNTGNDLIHIFPAINMVYTSDDYNVGGFATDASGGCAGMFLVIINISTTSSINIYAGGYLLGISSTVSPVLSIPALQAQVFICVGQVNGYTSWINVGGPQKQGDNP